MVAVVAPRLLQQNLGTTDSAERILVNRHLCNH